MANIHHLVSLGIGSPADIPHFTLFGLSPTGPVDIAQLDFCETTVVSLMPSRDVRSLMPDRSVESLMPTRKTPESCS